MRKTTPFYYCWNKFFHSAWLPARTSLSCLQTEITFEMPCSFFFPFLISVILSVGTVKTNTHKTELTFYSYVLLKLPILLHKLYTFELHNRAFTSFTIAPCWSQLQWQNTSVNAYIKNEIMWQHKEFSSSTVSYVYTLYLTGSLQAYWHSIQCNAIDQNPR